MNHIASQFKAARETTRVVGKLNGMERVEELMLERRTWTELKREIWRCIVDFERVMEIA